MKNEEVMRTVSKQIIAHKEAISLQLRAQEHLTKWKQWQDEADRQLEAGANLIEFWKDEAHNNLIAERQQISQDLHGFLAQRHSEGRVKPQAFRQLLPSERTQLQLTLIEHLKSTSPELLSTLSTSWDQLVRTISERITETANLESVEGQRSSTLKDVDTGLDDKPPAA